MFMLASLDFVKDALNITHTDDDAKLGVFISAASWSVARYVKMQPGDLYGIDSPPNSPPDDLSEVDPRIQSAVAVLVAIMIDGWTPDSSFNGDDMPWQAKLLLYEMRYPTMA